MLVSRVAARAAFTPFLPIVAVLLALGAPAPCTASTAVDDAIAWLQANQHPEGFWHEVPDPDSLDESLPATAEALAALAAEGISGPNVTRGLVWLRHAYSPTHSYVANQVESLAAASEGAGSLSDRLRANQDPWGGWGALKAWDRDLLDTAQVLRALGAEGAGAGEVSLAVTWLIQRQQASGAWGVDVDDHSSAPVSAHATAVVLLGIIPFEDGVPGAIAAVDSGVAWLLSNQNRDGGFGDDPDIDSERSNTVDTALALRALCSSGRSTAGQAETALQFLENQQAGNGSWDQGDVLATAVAVRALRCGMPNLLVNAADMSVDPSPADENQDLTLEVTVHSSGLQGTSTAIVAQFYLGQPDTGDPIGDPIDLGVIAAESSETGDTTWNTGTRTGVHEICMRADDPELVDEFSELDNVQCQTLVIGDDPNLTVSDSDVTFDPPAPCATEDFDIQWTVHNTGLLDLDAVVARVWLGQPGDTPEPIREYSPNAIAIGDSQPYVLSADAGVLPPGQHEICIDTYEEGLDVADESDPGDNVGCATVDIGVAPNLATLQADMSITPASVLLGQPVTVSFRVQETGGEKDVPDVETVLRDGAPPSGVPLQTFGEPLLEAGGSRLYDWDGVLGLGCHDLHVTTRSTDSTVVESDDTDNEIFQTICVVDSNSPPLADAGLAVEGDEGTAIALDGSASTDPENNIVAWDWDLDGDGSFDDASGERIDAVYAGPGSFRAHLRVTDGFGDSSVDDVAVTVRDVAATISAGPDLSFVEPGTAVLVAPTITDPGLLNSPASISVDWGAAPDEGSRWGLIGSWHLDDEASTTLVDSSGNGNDALLVGGGFEAGVHREGLDLTGANGEHALVSSVDDFADTAATISLWMKSSDPSQNAGLVSYAVPGSNRELTLRREGSAMRLYANGQAQGTIVGMTAGQWYHVVSSWRAEDGRIQTWIDGTLRLEDTVTPGTPLDGNGTLLIGQDQSDVGMPRNGWAFDGVFDEVRVYGRALSPDEIAALNANPPVIIQQAGAPTSATVAGSSRLYQDDHEGVIRACAVTVDATSCDDVDLTVLNAPPVVSGTPLDLTTWQGEEFPGGGPSATWDVSADGTSVVQTGNGEPIVFFGEPSVLNARFAGTLRFNTTNDGDWGGFVLGYEPGQIDDLDVLLLDWKRSNEGDPPSPLGLRLWRVTGTDYDAWRRIGTDIEPLAVARTLGTTPYDFDRDYEFEIAMTPTRIRVWIDGEEEIDLPGCFRGGRFGLFDHSQREVEWSNLRYQGLGAPEGGTVELVTTFTEAGPLDTHEVTVLWGDGSPREAASIERRGDLFITRAEHVYVQDGNYAPSVCITDDDGGLACLHHLVGVYNVAPEVEAGPAVNARVGEEVQLPPSSFTDVGILDSHSATVDWGDGSGLLTAQVDEEDGSGTVDASHVFLADGTYHVEVCVSDEPDLACGLDGLALTGQAEQATQLARNRPFYQEDFESGVAGPEWSDQRVTRAPRGEMLLGQFINDEVTLTLDDLPAHDSLLITVDFVAMRSWDGHTSRWAGPDRFSLRVVGGPDLVDASFSNIPNHLQSYPDDYVTPNPTSNPGKTGATAIDTLGYDFGGDATYAFTYLIPHSADSIQLVFEGRGLSGIDELWGIDNIAIGRLGDGPEDCVLFGRNLLSNPGAEDGPGSPDNRISRPLPGWELEGNVTATQYGASGGFPDSSSPGPDDRGSNFFFGGPNSELAAAEQSIDVSSAAGVIDAGEVEFELAGFLGGYRSHDDAASLGVTFRSSLGDELGTAQVGPVTQVDRGSVTALIERWTTGPVPAGTRTIDVRLEMTRVQGSDNDGYADDLSLILNGCDDGTRPGTECRIALVDRPHRNGGAFQAGRVALDEDGSFSTRFEFRIDEPAVGNDGDGPGGDGLAFVLHSDDRLNQALGEVMGYRGISPSVVVEFDTWNDGAHDDHDGNHVGLNVDGNRDSVVQASVADRMNDGDDWTAWIDYDGESQRLTVRLSNDGIRPDVPHLDHVIDLIDVLGGRHVFAGFTAGTRVFSGRHSVASWRFEGEHSPFGDGTNTLVERTPTVFVTEPTHGYYNDDLGTILDGTGPQFPTNTDPTINPADEPDLSPAAAFLGDWLGNQPPPDNGHWDAPRSIPFWWHVPTETAIVYEIDAGPLGIENLRGDFGVDNGIFVWVNGVYAFGAMAGGGPGRWEYPNIDLGDLPPGLNYVQVLREDHGGSTGYYVRIRGDLLTLSNTGDADCPARKPGIGCDVLVVNVEGSAAPVSCEAGPTVLAGCRTAIVDGATVTGADGQELTYTWSTTHPGVALVPAGGSIPAGDGTRPVPPVEVILDPSIAPCGVAATLVLTVEASPGDGSSCETTVTFQDNQPPAITCLPDRSVSCEESTHPDFTGWPQADDGCDDDPVLTWSDETTLGRCEHETTIRRTWTATDHCGNTASCVQVIEVRDTTPPTWDQTMPTDEIAECDAVPDPPQIAATDNCDTLVQVTYDETRTDGACADAYTLTRTWIATDDCGNSIEHVQVLQVRDTTEPTWAQAMPTDDTVECDAVPDPPAIAANDNCDDAVEVTFDEVRSDGACPDSYTLTRTWTATDGCNNDIEHVQVLQVQDTTEPTWAQAMPTDDTVECDAVPDPPVIAADDNCDDAVEVTFDEVRSDEACPDTYTLTRTWIATDNCGHAIEHVQVIDVQDTTEPTWAQAMPTDETVECDAVPDPPVVAANDNCDDVVEVTFDEVRTDGTCPDTYTLTRTWTATDDCDNETEHVQVIEVQDTTEPTWAQAMPTDETVECDAVPDPPIVAANDNCDDAVEITFDEVRADGACPDSYTLTRTWTAVDDCDNEVEHVQVIEVQDTTAPTFIGFPADDVVECDAVPDPAEVTAEDNCDPAPGVEFEEIRIDGACPDTYTLERTWTATDHCDNVASRTQVIEVQDTTPPVPTALLMPMIPVAPRSAGEAHSVCSPASSRLFRVSCEATDNCDPRPMLSARIEVLQHAVEGSDPDEGTPGTCVPVLDLIDVACDEIIEIRLAAAPCPVSSARAARDPLSVTSDGLKIITGEHVELVVTATDRCDNSAEDVHDPTAAPSPTCDDVLDDGTCCPAIAAAEPIDCPVPACGREAPIASAASAGGAAGMAKEWQPGVLSAARAMKYELRPGSTEEEPVRLAAEPTRGPFLDLRESIGGELALDAELRPVAWARPATAMNEDTEHAAQPAFGIADGQLVLRFPDTVAIGSTVSGAIVDLTTGASADLDGLASGDVDGDGHADLLVGHPTGRGGLGLVRVLFGPFQPGQRVVPSEHGRRQELRGPGTSAGMGHRIILEDVNWDGWLDVVACSLTEGEAIVHAAPLRRDTQPELRLESKACQ